MWRTSIGVLLLLLAALLLHRSFCEWRRFEYLETDAMRFLPRLMLAIDQEIVDGGNALFWDGERERFATYHALWFECFAEEEPQWAREAETRDCLARQTFPTDTPALKAIGLVRCQEALYGRVRARAAVKRCTASRGASATHLPRFSSEIIGPRFAGTYVRTWGLWAEAKSPSRWLAWVAGVAVPALLCLSAAGLVLRRFALRNRTW